MNPTKPRNQSSRSRHALKKHRLHKSHSLADKVKFIEAVDELPKGFKVSVSSIGAASHAVKRKFDRNMEPAEDALLEWFAAERDLDLNVTDNRLRGTAEITKQKDIGVLNYLTMNYCEGPTESILDAVKMITTSEKHKHRFVPYNEDDIVYEDDNLDDDEDGVDYESSVLDSDPQGLSDELESPPSSPTINGATRKLSAIYGCLGQNR
ncbi:hypothetical protein BCR41DRAFT_421802 [Lobosporangium transversale]|uniref:Uncharacterized protein n=1 Tax=Lobosporangium transversale TaxID=64571 RepID=A0A1Y2GPK5_9FUNG|nr:hypothetical protein BCR41DRAFT_421802 [Lobosporangium transversale]ORZ17599.1 hypothetical protein BCR41DRAFT_421802 [Lobosporangium transversale]|eukprot:XP_021881986.1 hypothetical protein BCR41DRAFT_421802 [Lobosporangium transversale]